MDSLPFERIGIAGLGLIGGSLARALAARCPGLRITGFDPLPAAGEAARAAGAVHALASDLGALLAASELVVLCQPVPVLVSTLSELPCWQARAGLARLPRLCDAASVKRPVLEAARALGAARGRFVGAHPIAGKAEGGWSAAEATLFEGRRVVLCEEDADAEVAAAVHALWRAAGATTVVLDAARHDAVYGALSHLPQLLTWAYLDSLVADPHLRGAGPLAGPGFASFTRLGRSNPGLWTGIALQNREVLLHGLDRLGRSLDELRSALERRDAEGLTAFFQQARACPLLEDERAALQEPT